MGCSKSSSKRKVYSNKHIDEDIRKLLNEQPIFTAQRTRKRKKMEPKLGRRKEIIKIRAEINELESKKINTKDQ